MKVLRNLVESTSFDRWIPSQHMLNHPMVCGGDCLDDHQAIRDGDGHFLMVYLSSGGSTEVDLSMFDSDKLFASWFNPRDR
jgi:hypothetical protein